MDQPPPKFTGNTYREFAQLNPWAKKRHEAPLEPDLPIIDPHHHFWDDESRGHYMVEDLAEDVRDGGHNVIATVYVETTSRYLEDGPPELQPTGEIRFASQVARESEQGRYGKTRFCAGIVGHADLTLGDKAKPVLEALIEAGGGHLKAIRYTTAWDSGNAKAGRFKKKPEAPRHLILDPTFRKGIACLAPLGLSYDSSMLYPQLPELADTLRALPDTTFTLNHVGAIIGIPPHDNRAEVFKVWHGYIRELAQYPNLNIKIGGLGMLKSGWAFHVKDTPPTSEELAAVWRPYMEACIEAFGPGRCMMESNFPPDKQTSGYGVLWNALKRVTKNYSASEKALLYRDTAARVYRLKV